MSDYYRWAWLLAVVACACAHDGRRGLEYAFLLVSAGVVITCDYWPKENTPVETDLSETREAAKPSQTVRGEGTGGKP